MILHKSNRIYLSCISAFSVIALILHMFALKFVYNTIEVLLKANEVTSLEIKETMAIQVDNLKRYSNYCTNGFYLICYMFLIIAGITLILRKIKLKIFLLGDLIFGVVQVIGITLFIHLFNVYELTEGFGRLRIIFRHKFFWLIAILPIIVYLLYGLLKSQKRSFG
jgi:hypothetical protein